jgi:methylenetetrahydrofolate reductase (NADPH)
MAAFGFTTSPTSFRAGVTNTFAGAEQDKMSVSAATIAMPELTRGIATLVRGFSIEATRPTTSDVELLKQAAAGGTAVYLSAVPTRPHQELIDAAIRICAAGFDPVPHLAARNFANVGALTDVVTELTQKARVRRVLMIAGDREQPAGTFRSAIEVIETGLLPNLGIAEIGIAGYPDGHPRIAPETLDRSLAVKIESAEQTGLKVHIATQFAFSADPILSWVRRLRERGFDHPVRIGLAGPTNLTTLLRYAQRCGVKASAQGLARQAGLAKHLFGASAPDGLITALAHGRHEQALGDIALHFFSFGGIAATARWAAATSDGRIMLEGGGFRVEPSAV